MQTSAKSAFVDGLTTLMLENPDEMIPFLWELMQRAMVMTVTNQFKASLENQISLIEHELLEASRVQIGTSEEANLSAGGAAQAGSVAI